MIDNCVIVRGGGDLASGVIHRLYRCGYRVLILVCERPSAIRRKVAFCEAVYDGEASVEGVCCRRISSSEECDGVWEKGEIPLLVDPEGKAIQKLKKEGKTDALVDAILAKKNLGTSRDMAPLTIALGPGFVAGEDVDFVVETMRGHDLARIISSGAAIPNTGVPGMVGGVSKERVIHSPAAGKIHNIAQIADLVEKGQILAYVGDVPVEASVTGVKDVISFDEKEILLQTADGKLQIRGSGLHVKGLNLEKGEATLDGHVDSLVYLSKDSPRKEEPLFTRLFR